MTDREAMQMALEALESGLAFSTHSPVLQNLRAALEQPEQEPVLLECVTCGTVYADGVPPQVPVQQQAEPVALIRDGVLCWHIPHEHYARPLWTAHGTHMLYTTPPQRKPLTDEEISAASKGHMTRNGFARAIEAAHGIKETP
jgi:hypothetical protein